MKQWSYITLNVECGPVSSYELRRLYNAGTIGLETLVWTEGMSDWEPLSDHSHLVKNHINAEIQNGKELSNQRVSVRDGSSRAEPEPILKKQTEAPSREMSSPVMKNSLTSVARGWILAFTVLAIVAMFLYPPFQIVFNGSIRNMGYGFLFSPPSLGNFTASIAVQILSIQIFVVLLVGGAAWVLSGYIPRRAEGELEMRAGQTVVGPLKSAGWVVVAGIISLVIFGVLMISLSFAGVYFSNQGMLEASLIVDSYFKLNALAFFSALAWFSGKFLLKDGPKRWGIIGVCIYLVAPIIPYFFSFFVTPNS